jgi:hypothetical protein
MLYALFKKNVESIFDFKRLLTVIICVKYCVVLPGYPFRMKIAALIRVRLPDATDIAYE